MKRSRLKRISATVEKQALVDLDKYVELQQSKDDEASRSSVINELIKKYIPT